MSPPKHQKGKHILKLIGQEERDKIKQGLYALLVMKYDATIT